MEIPCSCKVRSAHRGDKSAALVAVESVWFGPAVANASALESAWAGVAGDDSPLPVGRAVELDACFARAGFLPSAQGLESVTLLVIGCLA